MKTKVMMISNSQYDDWHIGDEGYIDGYVFNGNQPLAVIIIGARAVLASFGGNFEIKITDDNCD